MKENYDKKNRYIYAIAKVNMKQRFTLPGGIGDESEEIYILYHRNLAVFVSDVDKDVVEPTRKNMVIHQNVLQNMAAQFDLLPVSFGTVITDSKGIKELIDTNYIKIIANLELITGCFELDLRIIWHQEAFQKDLIKFEPKIAELQERLQDMDKLTTSEKVNIGEYIAEITDKRRKHYELTIFETLNQQAKKAKLKEPSGPFVALNMVFLVEREKEADFDRLVNHLYEQNKELFQFKYTGPWPAYNFVELSLQYPYNA